MPKKLLVLTSATGGGHDVHARATSAWCEKLFGNQVEVIVDHALENSHPVHRLGLETYHRIQTRAPLIQHVYYHLIELQEFVNRGRVRFGEEYYVDLLEKLRPDAILSVHDCLNFGYLEISKKVLGERVPFATYCTEFGGGYGFSRNWVNQRIDYFFTRTEEAAREALRRGVPKKKIVVAGHWAPPEYYEVPLSPEERARRLDGLGLRHDRFTVLLSTGGAGAENHLKFLDALWPLREHLQVIALCGHHPGTAHHLSKWQEEHPSFLLKTIPFTDQMATFLQLVSVVVARPGAATCGEALLSGCPIILNALGGIMPQEMPNWRYFKNHQLGFLITSARELPGILKVWLDEPEAYVALRAKFASLPGDPTPASSLKKLLGN